MMYRQLVTLLLIAVAAQATRFTNCGTGAPVEAEIHRVVVEGCEDAVDARCRLVRGRVYKIEVDATAKSDATHMLYTAKATILKVPIILLTGSACESLTSGNCPVSNGEHFVYENEIEIAQTYPIIQTTLTVEVFDDMNVKLICASVRFEIVDSLNEL